MMKNSLLLLFGLLFMGILFAQPLTVINCPPGYDGLGHGYQTFSQVEYNGNYYFLIEDNTGRQALGKYDGNTLTAIPNPTGMECIGDPIVYNGNLYIKYSSTSVFYSNMARWDGTTLTLINNPTGYTYYGYRGYPFLFQGMMYFCLSNDQGYDHLAKFDGTTISTYPISGYELDPGNISIYNNQIYGRYAQIGSNGICMLGKFTGTSIQIIPNLPNMTTMSTGYTDAPSFQLGGSLYLRYRDNSGARFLVGWNGTSLSTYPSPLGYDYWTEIGTYDDPYIFQDKAYLRYKDASGSFSLTEFDGASVTHFASPPPAQGAGSGYYGLPFVLDSVLYLRYNQNQFGYLTRLKNGVVEMVPTRIPGYYPGPAFEINGKLTAGFATANQRQVGVLMGDTVEFVPQVPGFNLQSDYGFIGGGFKFQNILYGVYEMGGYRRVFRYDGQSLVVLPFPVGYAVGYGYMGSPVVLGNKAFMELDGYDSNTDILTFGNCINSAATINPSSCGAYTAPDGQVYSASGTYTATIPNMYGCDSVVTVNLTILPSSASTISPSVCNNYTAPDGQVYTSSGIYTAIIPNAAGCDSTITINLTVRNSTASSISPTACQRYVAPNGAIYTNSGNYTCTIPNAAGCDSVIGIALTILNVNTTVAVASPNISANLQGAVYQWLDCNNGMAPIPGATGRTYTATTSGSYAVMITSGNCTDTSFCYNVNVVGVVDSETMVISIYPNPTDGVFHVVVPTEMMLEVVALDGRILQAMTITQSSEIDASHWSKGLYLLRFRDGQGHQLTRRLVLD